MAIAEGRVVRRARSEAKDEEAQLTKRTPVGNLRQIEKTTSYRENWGFNLDVYLLR